MTLSANLGFPRIGAGRELKKATEAFWRGESDDAALARTGATLRARHWALQREAGIDIIPGNDFSYYDQILDMAIAVGAIPPRFGWDGGGPGFATMFAMARGAQGIPAMEMTKWFDTNYHYIVPEFHRGQRFAAVGAKALDEYREARALGLETRPVLPGPVTFLMLGKSVEPDFAPLSALNALLPAYQALLEGLRDAGAAWVQIDEPVLVTDLGEDARRALVKAYRALSAVGPKIMLATYFGALDDNLELAAALPVAGLHVDLARAPGQLPAVLAALPEGMNLSLGLVDGRNVWRADPRRSLAMVAEAQARLGGGRVQVAPSCSLLHVPLDVEAETALDDTLRGWLAFARQKLEEVRVLARAGHGGLAETATMLAGRDTREAARAASARVHDPRVAERMAAAGSDRAARPTPFAARRERQRRVLDLPPYPTTTIGSFPQTAAVRGRRAAFRRGDIDQAAYEAFLREETRRAIRVQEDIGLDVLVHGEFERTDMVEHFGERLNGFAFTRAGWVQSYGSRCVKPPIIFGDVSRPGPMTVEWAVHAQSLTKKPVKGMLTGPVTILQWSFARDDQPRADTCRQIALAIRDEVMDLERAGIGIIQIDEPAFREGLPLRRAERDAYLDWAADCFRLTCAEVADTTQIHTHMCYSEFNDIMPAIAALDADVISIETSRSRMELLRAFADFAYTRDIGPGVWDIHSPRVPSAEEMTNLLERAAARVGAERLWVNPDCGLKTRDWPEVEAALRNMVAAARRLRAR